MSRPLLVFLLAIALLSACTSAETRKARFTERAEKLAAEHDYAKARLEYKNALQIDPRSGRNLMRAGEMSEKLDDFNAAVGFYQASIKVEPSNNRARALLGRLLLAGGLAEQAKKLVEAAPAGAPDPDLIAVRGAALQVLGDPAGALAEGERALHLSPGNENAASLLASLYSRVNRGADARRVVGQALKLTPDSIDLHVIMAQLDYTASDLSGAEEQLSAVIKLEPAVLGHRFRLAQFYVLNGEVNAAERTLREAIASHPDDVQAKLALADLIAAHRSFDEAEKSLKLLIAENGSSLPLRLGLGEFYASHGKLDQAEATYREIIAADEKAPQGLVARNRIAAIALDHHRSADVDKLLSEVLAANPRDSEALMMRAGQSLSRGDAPAAITDLRAVLRDKPDDATVLRSLARAYAANKDKTLAEETLRQAVRSSPTDVATRLELAKFLIDNGRAGEAQPVVDQLVIEQPGNTQGLEAAFRVQLARNDVTGARGSAKAIRTVDPQQPLGYYLAGLIDENDRKYDDALGNYEKALNLRADAIEPLSAAIRIDLLQKHPDKAISRIDAVLERDAANSMANNLKGELLTQLGRYDAAIASFERAIQLSPQWWVPYRGIAAAQLGASRRDAAIAAFQRGLERTHAPPLLLQLGAVFEKLGQPQDAITMYEAWLKREPGSDLAANNLAMLLITHRSQDAGARDRALELTRRFAGSGSAALVDSYGWVRYVRGEYVDSVAALQRAVELAPDAPLLRYHLGMAQFRVGKSASAREQLTAAVAGKVSYEGIDEARKTLALLSAGT